MPELLTLLGASDVTAPMAADLARLTRLAYAGSDPLPGLPQPDGQFETPDAVLASIAGTGRVYLAESSGRPVAALRVRPAGDCWRVLRVSTLPEVRGRGLVRLLLAAVASDAAADGVGWLELDAVVERCLPPLYARLGFHPVSHWPSPDKLLSELTMRRAVTGPDDPVRPSFRSLTHRGAVGWLLDGTTLLRMALPLEDADPLAEVLAGVRPGLHLAGLDLTADAPSTPVTTVAGPGRADPEHLMPRATAPGSLALWRPLPGREPRIDELTKGST